MGFGFSSDTKIELRLRDCQTDFLVRYFNDFEDLSSIQQKELKSILQELRKHNYLFKYINCRRNASYYETVQDERLILQELKSKVKNMVILVETILV